MQLTKRRDVWDPLREFEELSNRFNRFWGLTRGAGDGDREALAASDWSPPCEVRETDKEYRILVEVPNVKKEDVHVTLESGLLTIQGERTESKEDKGEKYHRRELTYGKFVRRFTMPEDADESQVDATIKDGMLTVVIGKAKVKQPKSRQIEVH